MAFPRWLQSPKWKRTNKVCSCMPMKASAESNVKRPPLGCVSSEYGSHDPPPHFIFAWNPCNWDRSHAVQLEFSYKAIIWFFSYTLLIVGKANKHNHRTLILVCRTVNVWALSLCRFSDHFPIISHNNLKCTSKNPNQSCTAFPEPHSAMMIFFYSVQYSAGQFSSSLTYFSSLETHLLLFYPILFFLLTQLCSRSYHSLLLILNKRSKNKTRPTLLFHHPQSQKENTVSILIEICQHQIQKAILKNTHFFGLSSKGKASFQEKNPKQKD